MSVSTRIELFREGTSAFAQRPYDVLGLEPKARLEQIPVTLKFVLRLLVAEL